jgi:hypothetical protein
VAKYNQLRQIYNEELRKGPFPTSEYARAGITGAIHGNLLVYLAEMAGFASRGERLHLVSDKQKTQFWERALRSIFDRRPKLRVLITPSTTPKLSALLEATERARLMIVRALRS